MKKDEFLKILKATGYPEPIEVSQSPNAHLDHHRHPFAVQALVIDGSIELLIDGKVQQYEVGDVFQLGYEQVHAETYGPQGVRYIASRKY
jgi:hypothetical protein